MAEESWSAFWVIVVVVAILFGMIAFHHTTKRKD